MSPSKERLPTYDDLIAGFLRTVTGPVPAADLVAHLLAARPSQAKNPRAAMRQRLREAVGRLLVFVDPDTVLPLRLAYQGVRFRLPLNRDVVKRGLLPIGDSLYRYLPWDFPPERLRFLDAAGQPIPFQARRISETVDTPLGRTDVHTLYADVGDWLRAENVNAQDHLLVTIVAWEQGVFRLEREPFSQHDPAQRAARNWQLADLFYELLESAANEDLIASEAVPTVYARLPDKAGDPPDHWVAAVAADERLYTDGGQIRYRDGRRSSFDLLEDQAPPAASKPISTEQGMQVFRFKAALAFRPGLWRTIEIQGKQTLADLDRALRGAFEHDTWDHLGGFWKLVPRGTQARSGGRARLPEGRAAKRTRFREVDLGDVDPTGGGTGARVKIAGLGLAVGGQLKYVYDFGDWIEHRLTLEAITAPERRAKYPREAARNQPQYANCVECQKKGRQRVAKWICVECSNRRDEDVLLCDDCSASRHEEHDLEEILY